MQHEDKNLNSSRSLARDLNEVYSYIKQREDSVFKILEAFSKLESVGETEIINTYDLNRAITQAEVYRVSQEDKITSQYAKSKLSALEDQS